MRIAIISDLHLGFRQYGMIERENDFYNQLYKVRDEINKCNPHIVIIAGDLFDKPNPSPAAINAYREGIGELSADMICAIKGNHTMILRDNHFSIDEFFAGEDFDGYYYLDDSSMNSHDHGLMSPYDMEFRKYIKTKVHIDGITYRNNSDIDEFLKIQKEMAEKCSDENYNILVVHQSFKEFCGFTGEELSINDIDYSPYDAVICGHIHSRFDTVMSEGTRFIQPGSIERMNTTEALDEQKQGKGFYLLDTCKDSLKFHRVECRRPFLMGNVSFQTNEDLENHLKELNHKIKEAKDLPILSYKYVNYKLNMEEIREKVGLMRKDILINKSKIDDQSQEEVVIEITDEEMPTVLEAIKMFGEKDDMKEDEIALAIDLYDLLNNNIENASDLLGKYFEKHKTEYHEERDYDAEMQEFIEYFGE